VVQIKREVSQLHHLPKSLCEGTDPERLELPGQPDCGCPQILPGGVGIWRWALRRRTQRTWGCVSGDQRVAKGIIREEVCDIPVSLVKRAGRRVVRRKRPVVN